MKYFLSVLCACLLFFTACTPKGYNNTQAAQTTKDEMNKDSESNEIQAEYHKINADEAKTMMDEKEVIILDVRTLEEYQEKHIPNAILIPNETIGTEQPEELPDKNANIMVYCRSGRRSKEAADKLVAMGYTNVYDFGGINDWTYDTVSEEGEKEE